MWLTPSFDVTPAGMVIVTERSYGPDSSPSIGTSFDPTVLVGGRDEERGNLVGCSELSSEGPYWAIVSDGSRPPPFVALAFFLDLASFSIFLLVLSFACFLLHSNTFNWHHLIYSAVGIGIDTFGGLLSTNKALEFISFNLRIKRLRSKIF